MDAEAFFLRILPALDGPLKKYNTLDMHMHCEHFDEDARKTGVVAQTVIMGLREFAYGKWIREGANAKARILEVADVALSVATSQWSTLPNG